MTGAMLRAQEVDRATYTVEAVAQIMTCLADVDPRKGGLPIVLRWLGAQLEDAGMVLSDGGKA